MLCRPYYQHRFELELPFDEFKSLYEYCYRTFGSSGQTDTWYCEYDKEADAYAFYFKTKESATEFMLTHSEMFE